MIKIRALLILLLLPIVGHTQIEPVSELETRPIIGTQTLPDYSDSNKEKHLYITF